MVSETFTEQETARLLEIERNTNSERWSWQSGYPYALLDVGTRIRREMENGDYQGEAGVG